jgi:hypothetical protein
MHNAGCKTTTIKIRAVGKKLGFEAEAEVWIQGAMGSVDEFRDTLIRMLAKRNNGAPIR